jgi:hypothetical protein
MRTVVLDYPDDVHDRARRFWQRALDAGVRRGTANPEYHVLEHPAALGPVLVQNLGDGPSRLHLDIESDDTGAEVARLVAAGAVEVARTGDWIVLRDPGGLLFCVVPAEVDADFTTFARVVGPYE